MFGFKGSTQGNMEWDAAGVDSGIPRRMQFGLGAFEVDKVHAIIDFDANDDGAPPSYVALPDFPIVKLPLPALSILGDDLYDKFQTLSVAGIIVLPYMYGEYPTDAPLSPVNRKQKYIINRPELVHTIGFQQILNNQALTAASNAATGEINIEWGVFSNAKRFIINEAYITGITKSFPESLEEIYIREATQLTIAPKFPKNVENVYIPNLPAGDFLTNINTKLEDLTKLKKIYFTIPAPYGTTYANSTTALSGDLDLSMTNVLEEVIVYLNNSLTSITLDPSLTGLTIFHAYSTSISGSTTFENVLDNNPNLTSYQIGLNKIYNGVTPTWTRDFTNVDIKTNMVYFFINRGCVVGDVNFTDSKTNMRDFRLGDTLRSNAASNVHSVVNISGITEAVKIYLQGCSIDDLELPSNTACTYLGLYDNNLDIVTNPNLITDINAMTGLTELHLGVGSYINLPAYGQTSTNGLGNNPSFSDLTNCKFIYLQYCKLTGTLTLPTSTNILQRLGIQSNTGLTTIANLDNHFTSLTTIYAEECSSLTLPSLSGLTNYNQILVTELQNTTINISGRTLTNGMNSAGGNVVITDCSNLTTLILPPATANFTIVRVSGGFNVSNNTGLTTITNLDQSGQSEISFNAFNNALNITFPFNSNFRPSVINIQDNGMSVVNVDASINNLYAVRASYVTLLVKSMNISGTNGAVTGTYQAPAGFVLGVSDGTPASAKEEIYVLVNNYDWTITYN